MDTEAANNYWDDVKYCMDDGGYIIPDDHDTTTGAPGTTGTPAITTTKEY